VYLTLTVFFSDLRMLETKLVLSFLLSGGPTGRILQGEELVEMNLMEESVTNENNDKSR